MDSFEVLDRLSIKSISILKDINPHFENLDQIRSGIIVDKISSIDERLSVIFKALGFTSKSKQKINLLDWLTAAYYEAMLINSDTVDVSHLFFALLLKIDSEKYYQAKKQYLLSFENKVEKDANNYIENLNEEVLKTPHKFIGRERELTKLIISLSSDESTPVLLLGDSGAGKTSLMYELAERINSMKVPVDLIGAKIYRVKFPILLGLMPTEQGGGFPSEYFSRLLVNMIEREKNDSKVILFIDDLRIGVNFFIGLGPNTKERKISLVAATQNDLQDKFWDSPISKLWNVISLEDQSSTDYKQIMAVEALLIEQELGLKFSAESIEKIIELYKSGLISDAFPGYGIKLLHALASYKIHISSNYEAISDVVKGISADGTATQMKTLKKRMKDVIPETLVIDEKDVVAYLGSEDDIFETKEDAFPKEKLALLEDTIKSEIIGQDEAIEFLARALRVSSLKLHFDNKPLGTFLFLGPTGVGKTETAKALGKFLYGTKDKGKKTPKNFLRIDMAEYSEKHAVSKLFGAPPGYIGYDENVSLADFVRENPYSIVLFDEIDKAHPEVLNSLLHIMDEAEIRTNQGEFVSVENIVVIMTSNHGAELIGHKDIGFGGNINGDVDTKEKLLANLKKVLKPEFLNRFDEIIVFRNLADEAVLKIAELVMDPIRASLKTRGINATISKAALKMLSHLGNVKEYGARDLKRTIKRKVMDPIAKLILSKEGDELKKIKIGLSAVDKKKIEIIADYTSES